jgi:hypothetical protein
LLIFDEKTTGANDFVGTTRYLEKMGMDMIEFREENSHILVSVDYYTRRL